MSLCLALSFSPIRLSLSLADMSDCPSDWVMNLLYQSPLWPLASCQIYCCRERKIWLPLLQTPSSCLQHLFIFPFPCPFQSYTVHQTKTTKNNYGIIIGFGYVQSKCEFLLATHIIYFKKKCRTGLDFTHCELIIL